MKRMERLAKDCNGIVEGLLMNPFVLMVVIIIVIIFAIMGGLAVLFMPNIAAAAVLILIGVFVLWKVPIPDPRMKLGVFGALILSAILIYFYGNQILGVLGVVP